MKVDAEPFGDDALEVDPPPAHDAVPLAIRTGLDDPGELSQLLFRQAGLGALGPVVEQTFRTSSVEAVNPVAQRLAVHAADLRRLAAFHPVANRRQRQKPPALVDVAAQAPEAPQPNSPLAI